MEFVSSSGCDLEAKTTKVRQEENERSGRLEERKKTKTRKKNNVTTQRDAV